MGWGLQRPMVASEKKANRTNPLITLARSLSRLASSKQCKMQVIPRKARPSPLRLDSLPRCQRLHLNPGSECSNQEPQGVQHLSSNGRPGSYKYGLLRPWPAHAGQMAISWPPGSHQHTTLVLTQSLADLACSRQNHNQLNPDNAGYSPQEDCESRTTSTAVLVMEAQTTAFHAQPSKPSIRPSPKHVASWLCAQKPWRFGITRTTLQGRFGPLPFTIASTALSNPKIEESEVTRHKGNMKLKKRSSTSNTCFLNQFISGRFSAFRRRFLRLHQS